MFEVILRIVIATILFSTFIVVIQDFLIFPGWSSSWFSSKTRNPETLPPGVESTFVKTSDGARLEVWHLPAVPESGKQQKAAIIFHGNAETVESCFDIQRWLRSLGISTYSFDYRGYLKSSGWPGEKGLYKDADAVWDFAMEREKIPAEQMIILGFSIGSGAAGYLASRHQVGTLILLAAYTSLPDLARQMALYRHLVFFLRHEFPTARYVSELKNTNLIAVHGKKDEVIPFSHLAGIEAAYKGDGHSFIIVSEEASHNNLMAFTQEEISEKLRQLP